MPDGRREILEALSRARFDGPEPPARMRAEERPQGRLERFVEALRSVAGQAIVVRDRRDLCRELERLEGYAGARQVCSLVPEVGRSDLDPSSVRDPHDLRDLDFAILPGEFGVAENGAVWVDGSRLCHRAICFLPEHLALVLGAADLVDDMHQAYERLAFASRGFGVFLSGPSKTADIEQALVIGAHGTRSLTVFLLE